MVKLYKIHRSSDDYHKWKQEETDKTIRKLIGRNILSKIQGVKKNSVIGFQSKVISTESFTGSKLFVENKDTITRRASITTAIGD